MPIEALGLALAAAFYPPAIVALIAVTRGEGARRRVFVYLAGAATVTFGAGVAMLAVLDGTGTVQRSHPAPGAAVELVLGVMSLAVGVWLWRRRTAQARRRADRALGRAQRLTRRLELIFFLGVVMYAPSPLYLGAMKAVADANLSPPASAAAVLALGSIVLLMVEIPALLFLLIPDRAGVLIDSANAWLRTRARALGAAAFLGGGIYLIARGLVHALG